MTEEEVYIEITPNFKTKRTKVVWKMKDTRKIISTETYGLDNLDTLVLSGIKTEVNYNG
jgi:hypothetical protein